MGALIKFQLHSMLIGSSNINARACYKRQNLTIEIRLVVDEASVIAAGNLVAWKIYWSFAAVNNV